ncbi:enoyl-CoA hydratase domain-containing protein 3, mitochondrial-like [Corticium candelabrum]|uniref:enoyl-CoA hydratase domain-containing protein 3, mitochondrial-like n=1 Tax=Corticium candelabrum TaxID=121492 RepID=UPI002E26EA64|nr:enoyl-CoA hydratase domain-containing protein 3, mitochondrial-like [Corticium candelabrum]
MAALVRFQKLFRCVLHTRKHCYISTKQPKLFHSGLAGSDVIASYIRRIVLRNTSKRNALSVSMLDFLLDAIEKASADADTRVIILAADGPVFSSGHDLKELLDRERRDYHKLVFEKCSELMARIQDVPVPVIAEVKGLATAAGCQLVASCDIAVAADTSQFATPGVKIGLFCSTPGVALGRSIPRKTAMKMLFTGEPISAEEAYATGLVSKVVPEDKLEEETLKMASKICEYSQEVISLGKDCFNKQMTLDRDAAYRLSSKVMVQNLQLADGQEGIQAFIDKRKPRWNKHKAAI